RLIRTLALAAVAIVAAPATVRADTFEITVSAAHGPQLPWIRMLADYFMPEVDQRLKQAGSKHNIVWKEAFSGALAKTGGELAAIEEGTSGMGWVSTIFEPDKLPLHAVTFMAPFGSDDAREVSRIVYELHQEMPELANEWTKHKQVFLASIATDTDYMLTKFPVSKIDDLKGRKIGAAGSLALWIDGIGGVPVAGDFATHYGNLKSGAYDGLIAFSTGFYPNKLHQVAPYATRLDLGSMMIGCVSINKPFFDKLPEDVQKILKDVGHDYMDKVASRLTTLAKEFEKKMAQEGAHFSLLPGEQRKRWANTMPNIAKSWVEANEARGLPARKVLTAYLAKLRENQVH